MDDRHTILVVDDSPDNLRLLGQLLEQAGYDVVVATTGHAAVERSILAPVPDLILLDVVMPGLDGFAVLQRLKGNTRTRDIPVIFISGIADPDKKIQGFELGAVDYITKPFQTDEVVARVKTHVQLNRIERLQHEIDERIRSEDALRQSEAILRKAQKIAHIGSWTWDIANDLLDWSDEMFAIFGISKDSFSGNLSEVIANAIHPDDRERVARSNASVAESNRPYPLEYRIVRPDGEIRTVWAEAGELLLDESGKAKVLTGIVQDITERERREEALRVSEDRYRSLLLTAMDGFWLTDLEGTILEANDAYAQMSGYHRHELAGMRIQELEAQETPEEILVHIRILIEQGFCRFVSRHRRKNGELFDVEISSNYWPFEGGRLVVFVRDITEQMQAERERNRLEQELHQAQKLESIGRLAGGVAHDFNNMLLVIQGHAELVMLDMAAHDPHAVDMDIIVKTTKKSAELTRQLLAFARKEVVRPRILDLNEATAAIIKMLQRVIGENIHLEWSPCGELWSTKMDPSQFDQILANLCLNSRDAIVGTGRITIEMSNRIVREDECISRPELRMGRYVQITVSDNGCGMDSETMARIFEPFFTTKGQGKGTGLGLATVYGVVKQNHGFIEVRSSPGNGTTFVILLPRHSEIAASDSSGISSESTENSLETILLVEDDPAILGMTRSILDKQGYRVLAAGSPTDAIELARTHPESIDLLLTDVIMPGMNGRELKERLDTVIPQLRHLYLSGYTSDIIANQGVLDKGVNFLQKPFTIKELGRRVRSLLDQPFGSDPSTD